MRPIGSRCGGICESFSRWFSPFRCCWARLLSRTSAHSRIISAANIRAHMAFLASDRLKGREAGSPEFDMAADYVAAQMNSLA